MLLRSNSRPSARVTKRRMVIGSSEELRKRTAPSTNTALQPAGWNEKGSSFAPQFCVVQGHSESVAGTVQRSGTGSGNGGTAELVILADDLNRIRHRVGHVRGAAGAAAGGSDHVLCIRRARNAAAASIGISPTPNTTEGAGAGGVGDIIGQHGAGEGFRVTRQGVVGMPAPVAVMETRPASSMTAMVLLVPSAIAEMGTLVTTKRSV